MPQRKDKMIISFDAKFYDLQAMRSTIQAYQGLADFKLKIKKKIFEVEASDIDTDVRDVFEDEFCNYVLSETKKFKSLCL